MAEHGKCDRAILAGTQQNSYLPLTGHSGRDFFGEGSRRKSLCQKSEDYSNSLLYVKELIEARISLNDHHSFADEAHPFRSFSTGCLSLRCQS